jgi:hypothetical protein
MRLSPRRTTRVLLLALCTVPLAGCLARQVECDGKQFRQALIGMYTDQVMDNLIRAYNNQPFVQLEYSDLTVQGDQKAIAAADVKQQIQTARQPGVLLTVAMAAVRTLANTYDLFFAGTRAKTLTFKADPVTEENDVYSSYIAFAHNPALFVASEAAPACEAHIARRCGHTYYWVPKEAGPAFLEHCMRTTFQRGTEPAVPTAVAYERQIVSVEQVKLVGPKEGDAINAYIVLNDPVPNGPGVLAVALEDGRVVRLPMLAVDADIAAGGAKDKAVLAEGRPTKSLRAQWSPRRMGFTQFNLVGRPARFYSEYYPPELPIPQAPSTLQRAADDLRIIRINTTIQNR